MSYYKNHYTNDNYNDNYTNDNNENYNDNYDENVATDLPYANSYEEEYDDNIAPSPTNTRQKRRKTIIISILCLIFFLILISVILGILFLIPRSVTFEMLPLSIDNSTIEATPEGFTLPLYPTVESKNDNFFNIYLDNVVVNGYHPTYGEGRIPMGTGSLENVILDGRSITTFAFPFLVQFNRTNDPELIYFSELLTNCSKTGDAFLFFYVHVDVNYHMWAKKGEMKHEKEVNAPCPISTEEAKRIRSLISLFF